MKEKSKQRDLNIGYLIDRAGISLFILCCFGYLLGVRRFAEWHIQFSFLNFPVFIGEIVFFICLILVGLKCYLYRPKWNKWLTFLMIYIFFILWKAMTGYYKWGPLALRDSALFYYPLCALCGYLFYVPEFFDKKTILVCTGIIVVVLKFLGFYEYYLLMVAVLAFVLIRSYPERNVRRLLWILLILVIPYQKFFGGSRTMLIGVVVSFFYFLTAFFIIFPMKLRDRLLFLLSGILAIIVGVSFYFDANKLHTFLDIRSSQQLISIDDKNIAAFKKEFVPIKIDKLKLYNPEVGSDPNEFRARKPDDFKLITAGVDFATPELGSAYGSISFRFHIWEDMVEEMLQKKPWLGFDFGKPLRSPRLEMLNYATNEWVRDGWIGAHNSYLSLIYRAGLIGVFLISLFLLGFGYLTKLAVQKRSVEGVLLCTAICFWLVAANFLLIFELPYNAIPLWVLVGITFAYLKKPKPQIELSLSAVKEKLVNLCDEVGLSLLILCFLGYMINARRVAESFVQLPFLNFPVFIGEQVLFLCLLLLVVKWLIAPPVWRKWYWAPIVYSIFIIGKALTGYGDWGPLALRDSALLYYPICFLFGYVFYNPVMLNRKTNLVWVWPILTVFFVAALKNSKDYNYFLLMGKIFGFYDPFLFMTKICVFYDYFLLMGVVVAALLIWAYPEKPKEHVRELMSVLLIFVIPYGDFFGSRTMFLGLVMSGVFGLAMLFYSLPFKGRYKLLILLMFFFFIIFGVLKYADVYKMKTLLNVGYYKELLTVYDRALSERREHYVLKEIKVLKLYNPESDALSGSLSGPSPMEREPMDSQRDEAQDKNVKAGEKVSVLKQLPSVSVPAAAVAKPKDPELTSVPGNVMFRIFIWRDMIDQMIQERPWFGFSFGKPLRSPSIEMLNFAQDEWARDGWIGAHNSLLHIIYRAGIVGIGFILTVLGAFVFLANEAVKNRSVTGVLCCSVLVFWIVSANFLLILELPYNAIPFWTLFGVTAAYLARLQKQAV